MRLVLLSALALTMLTLPVQAQSLKPQDPAPLQTGINTGTVDNMVGTHYWWFTGGPGKVHVHVKFKSMGLLGNPAKSTISVNLYDSAKTWSTPKDLTSDGHEVDGTFDGDLKQATKLMISVAPPPNGLVRMGGDYQIETTGAVAFGQKNTAPAVIGTYKQMCGYTTLLGTCKFLPDGNVQTTSGASGNWKLFDAATQTYVINIDGQERHSLQLMPGRGLCDDGGTIVFQELH